MVVQRFDRPATPREERSVLAVFLGLFAVFLLLFAIAIRSAFGTDSSLATTPGSGAFLETDTRVNGAAQTVNAEAVVIRPPGWTDRFNKCTYATSTMAGVFGASKNCYYVVLKADPNNAGPVHWDYGPAAAATSPWLYPGDNETVYAPADLNGNAIEFIMGTGCTSGTNCRLCATCQ